MRKIKLSNAYKLINHGPLAVVSSAFNGKETWTPIAWNMPVDHTPPLFALTISKENFINILIKNSKIFSMNILSINYVEEIKKMGSLSGRETDKLKLTGLTAKKCEKINCRYINASEGVIECILKKKISVGNVDIFIGEAVYCRASLSFSDSCWIPQKVKTIHHLGSKVFVTVTPEYQ